VIQKAVRNFQPRGTGSFRDRLQSHTVIKRGNKDQILISPKEVGSDAKKSVYMAAATAVHMDFGPMSFSDPSKGLADFAAAIFSKGQRLSASAVPDGNDMLPSASFVKSCLVELASVVEPMTSKPLFPRK
jgi:hypothetical protein